MNEENFEELEEDDEDEDEEEEEIDYKGKKPETGTSGVRDGENKPKRKPWTEQLKKCMKPFVPSFCIEGVEYREWILRNCKENEEDNNIRRSVAKEMKKLALQEIADRRKTAKKLYDDIIEKYNTS